MIVELTDTTASEILSALIHARRDIGVASGLVFTLVVSCTGQDYDQAFEDVQATAAEHPSRILMVVPTENSETRLDAQLRTGEGVPGDLITLWLGGEVRDHPDSVALPLLLPDLPVVVWWPGESPDIPTNDPLGALGTRRITDSANASDPLQALLVRARNHQPGDSDLAWTRLTSWRALITSALDQCHLTVLSAAVESAPSNAPAALMQAWLHTRLRVPTTRMDTSGEGMHAVRLVTSRGEVSLVRTSPNQALYVVPNQPQRQVALARRGVIDLLSEELRRLDQDIILHEVLDDLAASEVKEATGASR